MNKNRKRRAGVLLAGMLVALNYSPWVSRMLRLPDELYLAAGQSSIIKTGLPMQMRIDDAAVLTSANPEEQGSKVILDAIGDGEAEVTFSLLGLMPVHRTRVSVAQERMLIPGGQAIGVALRTKGVLVVAKNDKSSILRVGDVILSVENEAISSAKELSACVNEKKGDSVGLEVLRDGNVLPVQASVSINEADGKKHLGVWVRDSTAGVGTLSYIDPKNGTYGALGHAIVDCDTGSLLQAQEGAILRAAITGVTKGKSGKAGELHGSFLRENDQLGDLTLNSAYGIYGKMDSSTSSMLYPEGLPVGGRSAVHTGAATILSTVDENGPREYAIQIVKCMDQDSPSQKGMVLRVMDERLLEKTGGIVQGMSGSPIIQDGRIIGAVTHVYLNDSAMGYGMYIEWMLEKSDGIAEPEEHAA